MTGKIAALFTPIVKAAKLASWPVGSIYMSMVATNPVFWHKRKAFCRIYDFNCIHRRKRSPQQHAAIAGRGPLEARGIGYAVRKGVAGV